MDHVQIEQLGELQTQQQRLSAQQMLVVSLLQLSTQEMEERVRAEILDNPALEGGMADDVPDSPMADDTDTSDDTTDELSGNSMGTADDIDREYGVDDDDDSSDYRTGNDTGLREEIPIDAGVSFFDLLREQLGEQPLTDKEQAIGLFLIGSLDDDGWLRKSINEIVEVLAFRADIETTAEEVEDVLRCIQTFEPAGVGARNLQECLLLQLDRKEGEKTTVERRIVTDCFDDFTSKRWDHIPSVLGIAREEVERALCVLTHLNPHPGSALSEMVGRGLQQLVPDFIMDDESDDAEPMLNDTGLPTLRVSREFRDMLAAQASGGTPAQREAARFLQQKIDSAQGFIQAVRQRQQTLSAVMKAIVSLQRDFFQTGDENLLKPMILQDVEEASGYDISTISRISNTKYVQTRFGIFPLKFFFSNKRVKVGGSDDSESYINQGEALKAMSALIESEDKAEPLTDDRLAAILTAQGFHVARRTVAKYRDLLGIPVAKMRRR